MAHRGDGLEPLLGADPQKHLDAIATYREAVYDHVCVHQVGPDQEGFMEFYARDGRASSS